MLITGKRSEIIKIAPILRALRRKKINPITIDVSQHRGWLMKGSFYLELGYPKPNYTLEYGAGVRGGDVFHICDELSKIISEDKPDYVVAAGASDTVLAAARASVTLEKPFLHVESGYRSYDLECHEEINRQFVDGVSTFHYAPTRRAYDNLMLENVSSDRAVEVGSTVIDSLTRFLPFSRRRSEILDELDVSKNEYLLLTLHKEENIAPSLLTQLLRALRALDHVVVFPMHPETRGAMKRFSLYKDFSDLENLLILEPLDYLDFLKLEENARLVLTDSGEVCEEATFLEKPLLILGKTVERPEPLEAGAALLSPLDRASIIGGVKRLLDADLRSVFRRVRFAFGRGEASERISDHILRGEIEYLPPRITLDKPLFYKIFYIGKELTLGDLQDASSEAGCTIQIAFGEDGEPVRDASERVDRALISGDVISLKALDERIGVTRGAVEDN
ncbi:MAG: non-hydrolyzing UDP-N-acetylglucosamine 2-epimerase [Candidatus Geothermarchaeales archaeon]